MVYARHGEQVGINLVGPMKKISRKPINSGSHGLIHLVTEHNTVIGCSDGIKSDNSENYYLPFSNVLWV